MSLRLILLILFFSPGLCVADNASLDVPEQTLNQLVQRLGMLSGSGTYQPTTSVKIPGTKICHSVTQEVIPGLDPVDPIATFSGMAVSKSAFYLDCPPVTGKPGTGREPPGGGGEPVVNIQSVPGLVLCEMVGGGIEILPAGEPVFWQWWVTAAAFEINNGSMTFSATVRSRVGENVVNTTRDASSTVTFDAATNRIKIHIPTLVIRLEHEGEKVYLVNVAKLYSFSIPIEPQTLIVPMLDGTTKTISGRVVSISPQYQQDNIHIDINLGF